MSPEKSDRPLAANILPEPLAVAARGRGMCNNTESSANVCGLSRIAPSASSSGQIHQPRKRFHGGGNPSRCVRNFGATVLRLDR